jgi:homospermidine synthase
MNSSKIVLFSVLFAGLLLAGCASQSSPSPTPLPTVLSTPTPAPTVEATAEPTVEATPTPQAKTLEGLRDDVKKVLEETFGKPVSFESDRNPASGSITYLVAGSATNYDYQVTVMKAISKQWAPDKNVVSMQSEKGVTQTIVYSVSNPISKIHTDAEIECGDFSFLITLSFEESYTGINPTGDVGLTLTKKLIDACDPGDFRV